MMKYAIRLGTEVMKGAIRLGTDVMKDVTASRRPGRQGVGRVVVCDSGHVGTPSPPPLSALRSPLQGGSGEADESARWLLATGIISSSWPPF